jgi:mono/diheme cytochrome c family protein
MKFLFKVVFFLIVIAAAGGAFIYSGIYNVAATHPHLAPTKAILSLTMDRSVARHAQGINAPDIKDTAMIHLGFGHFQEMCVQCHGAPGVQPAEMAKGLNPDAPQLADPAGEWSAAELFWITKNGIKMTGMPAFAPTHSDKEIWAIVAFMKKLPSLDSASYLQLKKTWGEPEEDHPHGHH